MPRERKHCQLGMKVSIQSLPVKASDRGFRTVVGWVGMVAGILFVVGPWVIPVSDPKGEFVCVALPLSALGLGLCISGLYHLTRYASLTITSEAVTFAFRKWSDRQQWSEPLANYEGVLLESEMRPGAQHKHLFWNILLEHTDEGRRILLQREPSERKARRFQEHCCRLLELAALEPTAEGVARREVEDIGEPLREVPAEPDGQAGRGPAAPVPASLKIHETPSEAEVTLLARMPPWQDLILVPIAAAAWVWFASQVQGRWLLVMTILASIVGAWGFLAWLLGAISRFRLRITDEGVELIRELPLGQWRVKRLGCDEIVAVTITKRADQFHEAVVLRSRYRQIRFGKRLKLDELKWLKGFILDRLAQSSPAAASPSH